MIEKVSDITYHEIADYIRIDVKNDKNAQFELETYLNIAKDYISNYTGIPKESSESTVKCLDDYPDFIIAIYVLCQDMYDNRSMYVDEKNMNKVVQTVLGMHAVNNL